MKPPAQPQRTQSAEEFYKVWIAQHPKLLGKSVTWPISVCLFEFAEAYAQSLKQAAAPTEPVADPSKEELKAECEMLREELCYHRDYWAEWNMRALTAQAQKEELKTALGQARDYVVGLSAYLATCATATIFENLETTITSLHKERDYLERLLSGDGKE